MNWKISCEIFNDDKLNKQFTSYFEIISEMFSNLIPDGPALGYIPLRLINSNNGQTIYWPLNNSEIKMGLNFTHKEIPKACFQFAHLLSHIYIDPRVNNWFIESVCNMSGLDIIQALDTDVSSLNKIELNGFESFEDYYKKKVRITYSEIDHVQNQHSTNWIKREVKKIKCYKDSKNPVINNLIAFELLPYYNSNPELWNSLKYFGKATNPSPPSDINDLSSSNTVCPDFVLLKSIIPNNKDLMTEIINKIWG